MVNALAEESIKVILLCKVGSIPITSSCPTKHWAYHNMNQTDFVTGVYEVAWQSNPDLDSGSTFQEILEELKKMKDKSLRWDILVSSFKEEVERPTLRDTQAARQGQL